ncbi:MAG: hypothetical protein AAF367_19410 [Pseudomonadota bacterium]
MIVMLGGFLLITILACLAYEAVSLILSHQGILVPVLHPWLNMVGVSFGPPLLIASALFAWERARRWRRMDEMRGDVWNDPATALARGEHRPSNGLRGPGFLERASLQLALLGVVALPYWLVMPSPALMAGGAILVVWIARAMFRSASG